MRERIQSSYISPGISILLDGLSIREWARRNVDSILDQFGYSGTQVKLKEILQLRKIQTIQYNRYQQSSARLIARSGGFKIILNERYKFPAQLRKGRFVIAHEFGHTFFYDLSFDIPRRYSWLGPRSRVEETICNTFASELLMPASPVCARFNYPLPNVSDAEKFLVRLIELSDYFEVSHYAMGIRLIQELQLWGGLVLCCSRLGKFSDSDLADKSLRVLWGISSKKSTNSLYLHRPESPRGPFMKLRWPTIEEDYKNLISRTVKSYRLNKKEISRFSNIKNEFSSQSDSEPIEIMVMKIGKHPLKIPLDKIENNEDGLDYGILIAIPQA